MPLTDLSKDELCQILHYHYSDRILRRYTKESFGKKAKLGKGSEGLISFLSEQLDKAGLAELISDLFHTTKHHTYVFELRSGAAVDLTAVRRKINGRIPAAVSCPDARHITHRADYGFIEGVAKATVRCQRFSEETGGYTGPTKDLGAHIPFRISFSARHMKVKLAKFAPAEFPDETGLLLAVHKVLFDEDDFSAAVASGFGPYYAGDFARTNLVSAVQALVRLNRIGTTSAKAEVDGRYIESRSKNKTDGSLFVDIAWHSEFLMPSHKVWKARWWWIDQDPATITSVHGLESHTIDPELGKFSQDGFCEKDLENLIDEAITRNDEKI